MTLLCFHHRIQSHRPTHHHNNRQVTAKIINEIIKQFINITVSFTILLHKFDCQAIYDSNMVYLIK